MQQFRYRSCSGSTGTVGKKEGYWKKHLLYEFVGNESPLFVDVDKDGRDDLVCADSKSNQVIWLQAPVARGDTAAWKRFPISGRNVPGTDIQGHGMGFGDINKDGRPDVVSASAHRYGICWHPQLKDDEGNELWDHYTISFSTSQTHATAMADFNGDGIPDLVTGKRYFAHLERLNPSNKTTIDPRSYEKPAIYWFELTPGKAPFWKEHLIDDDSGIGLNTEVQDMNGDGRPDIVVANKQGIFYFENLMTGRPKKN